MWFKNRRDEGIMYPDYFSPILIPSIALILTAVSFPLPFYFFNDIFNNNRLKVTLMSGLPVSRPILYFGLMSIALFMKAMLPHCLNSESIRNPRTWTFSVASNRNFTTMAGTFFYIHSTLLLGL